MSNTGKRKILFLIHTLGGGGAEKVLVDTVNKLDKSKFDVTVMTVINTGINIQRLGKDIRYKSIVTPPKFLVNKSSSGSLSASGSWKVRVFGSLYNALWRVMPCRLLHRLYIRDKYDTEVAFLEGISAKIIAASPDKNSKKICWIHVDFANEHKSGNVFLSRHDEQKCYQKFDELVCVSDDTCRGFEKVVAIDTPTRVLRNIIDVDEVVVRSKEGRHHQSKAVKMCSIGRLAPQKGYDRLLSVVKRLNQDGLKFDLTIIGDGPMKDDLKSYIRKHAITNVTLAGFQPNPYKYVRIANLFVISSRAEGFSTVMTEAIAIGTATLTTKVSGTSVLSRQMVVENDEEALYLRLRELISNATKLQELAKVTRQTQAKLFADIDQAVRDVEEVISC